MSETNKENAGSVRAAINEKQLLGSLKHLFASGYSMLGELMQNARRAGATRIDVQFNPAEATLVVSDDGHGIQDFQDLVVLAQSGWDKEIVDSEQPFGMGLFSVLFAAAEVTFRSRGKALRLTLQDVVDRVEIQITTDPNAQQPGTQIELRGLAAELLAQRTYGFPQEADRFHERYQLFAELAARVRGFPIDVYVNGHGLPRPDARAGLEGEDADIGFVSLIGVHRRKDLEIGRYALARCRRYYLQGLPIGSNSASDSDVAAEIVHLDSRVFIAKMPDRSHLYNERESLERITKALDAVVLGYLQRQKAEMSPQEFVRKHWQNCLHNRAMHLMCDVNWVPKSIFYRLTAISADQHASESFREDLEGTGLVGEDLLSREDIASGRFQVWRHVPDLPSESPPAAMIMKLVEREGVCALRVALPNDHWVNSVTPSTSTFTFDINVLGVRGEAKFDTWDWSAGCRIHLADRAEVVVDPNFGGLHKMRFTVVDDWLLLPDAWQTDGLDGDFANYDQGTVCYVLGNGHAHDHPVDALSAYLDENETYREEWHNAATRRWDAAVGALRGDTIAGSLRAALDASGFTPSATQVGEQALVVSSATVLANGDHGEPRLSVLCLQRRDFWDRVAAAYEGSHIESSSDRLMAAFGAAVAEMCTAAKPALAAS